MGKERHDIGRVEGDNYSVAYPVRAIRTDEYLYIRNLISSRWPAGNPEYGFLNCDNSPTKNLIVGLKNDKILSDYYEMSFGNGGTSVDPTGIITYLTPNSTGTNASLYNQTYTKVVDEKSVNNTDPARNKTEIRHVSGTNYTDILVSCLLDYGEPSGQEAFDNATDPDNQYVFDELGLRSYSASGQGRLVTHVIFHPVQKSLNRLIQIDYTVRVQSLAG